LLLLVVLPVAFLPFTAFHRFVSRLLPALPLPFTGCVPFVLPVGVVCVVYRLPPFVTAVCAVTRIFFTAPFGLFYVYTLFRFRYRYVTGVRLPLIHVPRLPLRYCVTCHRSTEFYPLRSGTFVTCLRCVLPFYVLPRTFLPFHTCLHPACVITLRCVTVRCCRSRTVTCTVLNLPRLPPFTCRCTRCSFTLHPATFTALRTRYLPFVRYVLHHVTAPRFLHRYRLFCPPLFFRCSVSVPLIRLFRLIIRSPFCCRLYRCVSRHRTRSLTAVTPFHPPHRRRCYVLAVRYRCGLRLPFRFRSFTFTALPAFCHVTVYLTVLPFLVLRYCIPTTGLPAPVSWFATCVLPVLFYLILVPAVTPYLRYHVTATLPRLLTRTFTTPLPAFVTYCYARAV